jgi:hypothetical protein
LLWDKLIAIIRMLQIAFMFPPLKYFIQILSWYHSPVLGYKSTQPLYTKVVSNGLIFLLSIVNIYTVNDLQIIGFTSTHETAPLTII